MTEEEKFDSILVDPFEKENPHTKENEKLYVLVSKDLNQFIQDAKEIDLDIIYNEKPKNINFLINNEPIGVYKEGTLIKITTNKYSNVVIESINIDTTVYSPKQIIDNNINTLSLRELDENVCNYTTTNLYKCIHYDNNKHSIVLKDTTKDFEFNISNLDMNSPAHKIAVREWYNLSLETRQLLLTLYIQIYGNENLPLELNGLGVPVFNPQFYSFVFKMLMSDRHIKDIFAELK